MTHTFRSALSLLVLAAVPLNAQRPAGSTPAARARSQPLVEVGPNVQVSGAHAQHHLGEVLLDADPGDPRRLLGCGIVYAATENRRWTVVYLSEDRGASWRPVLETKRWPDSADPACAFGADGAAHHIAIATQDPKPYVLAVYRSADGGRTWTEQPPVSMKHQGIDRQSIVADATGGKYHGQVYVIGESSVRTTDRSRLGTNGMGAWVSRDGGRTFSEHLKVLSPGTRYTLGVGNSAVLSDGTVASVFGELRNSDGQDVVASKPGASNAILNVFTTSDGGESLDKAVKIDDYHMVWPPTPASASPTIAADRDGPFKDRLYVTWADERSGRAEIYFSSSRDKGKTWSPSITIDENQPFPDGVKASGKGPNNFNPTVAVNKEGVVGVMWYDRREHPDNLGWDVRFRASLDGGETWLPSVKVSTAPAKFDERSAVTTLASVLGGGTGGYARRDPPEDTPLSVNVSVQGRQFNAGDYAGLAADAGGVFHPFWLDNRTGVHQIWTAAVTVKGRAAPRGGGALETLADISRKVTLEVTSTAFDPVAQTVSMTVRLKNTSKDTIVGPFSARVLHLSSPRADDVELLGSTNGVGRAGAVLDLSDVVRGGSLPPAGTSEPKSIAFRLRGVRPLRDGTTYRFGLVSMKVSVLAPPDRPPPR